VAVAKEGQLASELVELRRLEQVEHPQRRAGKQILADAREEGLFEGRHAVFAKLRDVELQHGAGAAVGGREAFVAAGAYVAVETGLAVAHDRARGVTGGRLNAVVEPAAVTARDENLGVETAERLGKRVFDLGPLSRHGRVLARRSPDFR
jgi:hypothetical protein